MGRRRRWEGEGEGARRKKTRRARSLLRSSHASWAHASDTDALVLCAHTEPLARVVIRTDPLRLPRLLGSGRPLPGPSEPSCSRLEGRAPERSSPPRAQPIRQNDARPNFQARAKIVPSFYF